MKLSIRRFEAQDRPAIERLNARLQSGGVNFPVYGEDGPEIGGESGYPISERLFVAADGGEVRGAVWLREHEFWVYDRCVDAGWAKYPVSESLIDSTYQGVPAGLVVKLLREQPKLMALGLGGHAGPFARLLASIRWTGLTVPFFFRVIHPYAVLRQLTYVRRRWLRRALMDLLAFSGAGWLGHQVWSAAGRSVARRVAASYRGDVVDGFGPWADAVWERNRASYRLVARRDAAMLARLYPSSYRGLTRLRVTKAGDDVGWICVHRADLRNGPGDRRFGALAVGLLADAFAAPEHALGVLYVGLQCLRDLDVDLVFTNQSHPAWIGALRALQFLEGPSNFAFYRSPQMEAELAEAGGSGGIYVNRGDCDGPRWW